MNRKQRRAQRKGQGAAPLANAHVPLQELFSQAVRHYQAGQSSQADKLCRQVLAADARHADSLYLLGILANRAGRHGDAAALISQAISSRNNKPVYHCHLGIALRGQGKLEEAEAAFQRALALDPSYVDARHNLANTLYHAGRLEAAVSNYDRVLDLQPDNVEAHHNRGNALQQQGKLVEAVESYQHALALKADHPDVHNNLGVAFSAQGLMERALACYERAVSIEPDYAEAHHNRGNALKILGRLHEALATYRRVLDLVPNHPFTYSNMGAALMALDLDEAERCLRRALELSPNHVPTLTNLASTLGAKGNQTEGLRFIKQALEIDETEDAKRIFVTCVSRCHLTEDDGVLRTLLARALDESWGSTEELARAATELIKLNPHSGDVARLSLLGSDRLLCALLRSTPISDVELERFLTMTRRSLLALASGTAEVRADGPELHFYSALASQCFINEYVFSCTDEEMALASLLRDGLVKALDAGTAISPHLVLVVAFYFPLAGIRNVACLLRTSWPSEVEATLRQQVREPLEELDIRATIPRLTEISDEVSVRVRDQYEENPYPRWIKAPPIQAARDITGFFRNNFPLAPIRPYEKRDRTHILIAGCGTGRQSIVSACRFQADEVLAVDLSISSLGYARRKTEELGLNSVTYAQADLMRMGALGLSFDIVESAGVLHHLANPWAGWRVLLSMLRPGGFMKVGLYSERARRHIVEIRKVIERRGYQATPDDIRRCRRDLMNTPGAEKLILLLAADFFSVSGCRDLLFHVQEHRTTLSEIETFLRENDLTFLGFDNLHPTVLQAYRKRFPDDPAATQLGQWQAFENDNPETFLAMYQFSVQKGPAATRE